MSSKEASTSIRLMINELTPEQQKDFYAITRGFIHMIRRREKFGNKRIAEVLEMPEYMVKYFSKSLRDNDSSLSLRNRRDLAQILSDRSTIIDCLMEAPYLKPSNIAADLGMDISNVKNDIYALKKLGFLRSTKTGYQITE